MGNLPFEKIQRTLLVRKEAKTDPKYGCDPTTRPVSELLDYSIVNLDKPSGPTSHQTSSYMQKVLGVKKGGHSGTLDPKVTGVLPVAIGRATRIVQLLLTSGKEYVCLMHLHSQVDEDAIRKVCAQFVGKIKQLPPIKSAVKRQWRYRKVYYLEILEINGQDVLFTIGCQAGTYIRKICHDIGQALGCGAHMAQLRRSKAGGFNENDLFTLQDVTDALWYYKNEENDKFIRQVLLPIERAVDHIAKVYVLDSTVDTLCHGSDLKVPGISKVETDIQVGEFVAVMTLKGELVAYGLSKMISKGMVESEKGIAVDIQKVFMLPGTYPKHERKEVVEEKKE